VGDYSSGSCFATSYPQRLNVPRGVYPGAGHFLRERNYSYFVPSNLHRQRIAGKLLGDGCLEVCGKGGRYPTLKFDHGFNQICYMMDEVKAFGSLFKATTPTSCKHSLELGRENYTFQIRSRAHPFLAEYYKLFYSRPANECTSHIGKKRITSDILGLVDPRINPLGLALWFGDDGSLAHKDRPFPDLELYLGGLSDLEYLLAEKWFRDLGLKVKLYHCLSSNSCRLRFGIAGTRLLFPVLRAHFPDSIKFKFEPLFRVMKEVQNVD
jgi:hypothetical protein